MKLNFENGNFDVEIVGSHGQGTIDATYAELEHCFGKPKGIHDDHKCDVEWNIKFADGTIACIYNWKNGLNYCGVEKGLRLGQMTSFSVGGFNENAVTFVKAIVNDHQLEKELSMQGAYEEWVVLNKTNLRVDVSYIIERLEGVLDSDCIGAGTEELLEELQENNKNHKERQNA
jgi:hypothetical protein